MALLVSRYEISFPLMVPNISNLDSVYSQEVTVQNIPWKIKIYKEIADAREWLNVYLHCEKKDAPADWSCAARLSVKLKSFDRNIEPIEIHENPHVFDTSGIGFGTNQFVEWRDLFDAANSYVKDDTIQLEIKIEAADPTDKNKTKLTSKAQDKCCENGPLVMYLLTVDNVDKLMAVRSPEFKVRGLPFDLSVLKSPTGHLHIRVDSKTELPDDEIYNMRITSNLLSFKAGVKPQEIVQTEKLCGDDIFDSDEIISWEALFDPKNGFVDENAIKIQVKIEMDKPGEVSPAPKRRRICNSGANVLQIECAICHEDMNRDQSVSSTACGHVFCTECILTSIANSNACPNCKLPISEDTLLRVYLPIRN